MNLLRRRIMMLSAGGGGSVYTIKLCGSGYITTDGKLHPQSWPPSYNGNLFTDYIEVKAGDIIELTAWGYNDVNIISFYTSPDEDHYIGGTQGGAFTTYSYTAPTDGFVRLNCHIGNFGSVSDNYIVGKYTLFAGHIGLNGNIYDNADYQSSTFIPVNGGEKVTTRAHVFGEALAISYYDTNKNFVSGLAGIAQYDGQLHDYEMIVPSAGYVKVSCRTRTINREEFNASIL